MKQKSEVAGLILVMGLIVLSATAQLVGTSISIDGTPPNTNAMLDIQSPSIGDGKGLLIPRVSYAQRSSANAALNGGLLDDSGNLRGGPAQGLLVYQTNGDQGLYYNISDSATPSWVRVGDFQSDGSVAMANTLFMGGNVLSNTHSIHMNNYNVQIGAGTRSYSCSSGSVAIGRQATARYRIGGVAIGTQADGDYNGVAFGHSADGQYSNLAVGFEASAYSGYDRIAIGRSVTNRRNHSAVIRGTLYLDGGTGLLMRSSFGSGGWTAKAFTIPHPLNPEEAVLRHFCVEGPQVLNIYEGRSQLVNGEAVITLPDYYSALNLIGSESYSLTPIGAPASLYIKQRVTDNQFIVAGDSDVKFSWIVHVRRNDAACLEDLKQRPVEQMRSEIPDGQIAEENRSLNTTIVNR